MSTPREEHASRKVALERLAEEGARLSRLISTFRLVSFLGACTIAFARGFGYLPAWFWWPAGGLAIAFVFLVFWHVRLDQKERRVTAAIDYHKWAIERLDGKFEDYPAKGERFLSDEHPYALDLGIFGQGSVFQLIDATRTRRGEDTLARWLSEPGEPQALLPRQEAVRDLAERESMREELAVLGALIAADKPNPEPLLVWAEADPTSTSLPVTRPIALVVPMLTICAFVLAELRWLPLNVLLALLAAEWAYALWLLPKIEPSASAVSSREGALARYRSMLEVIESQSFEASRLLELQNGLKRDEKVAAASEEIRRLSTIVGFLDARRNEVFRFFIGPLLLWDAHCVLSLEAWRRRAGKDVRRWLEVIGEVEALSSLAGFAHDHPEHAWPTLSELPAFSARALGHPLIDPEKLVRNDVELRGAGSGLLVTGSNMSGKSTLLRSMGVNAVLAMAGAPVVAEKLLMSPLEVRTSMWARDSLVKGVSHFYAELQKLKRVVDGIKGDRPLFFLLDEILQGTNSRERVIGARSVLRHLLEHGAMGAVSTHDVGLLDLPPELDAKLDKVHFQEQVHEDKTGTSSMTFDYRLRPGVVRSTNALRLMRLVGIDVDLE